MKYKGYTAKVEFDEDAGILHGRVLGIRDIVDFQADRLEDVVKAFQDSVDDYLAFCAERGERPDKPFSGKLVFRTSPEVHRKIAIAAELKGKSINQFIEDATLHATSHS